MGGLVKAWSSIPPSGGGGDFLNQNNYIGCSFIGCCMARQNVYYYGDPYY